MSSPITQHEDADANTSNSLHDPSHRGSEPISRSPDPPPQPETVSTIIKSRYDQPALDSASTTYASTLSHERTTMSVYSSMESEMQKRGQRHNADVDTAGSVYSYNSTRDINQFVKEFHGRCDPCGGQCDLQSHTDAMTEFSTTSATCICFPLVS
jgi:hypothetical protein